MGAAVMITRMDRTAAELRSHAGKFKDAAQVRRLLALALVLEGVPRTQAALCNGMDRQTLRDWVHHYNTDGESPNQRYTERRLRIWRSFQASANDGEGVRTDQP